MIHLTRASNDGVADCRCKDSLMGVPDQSETPWDGSGWQMACHRCGKSFTFGKAISVNMTLRDFILADLRKPITDDKAREVLFGAMQYQRR